MIDRARKQRIRRTIRPPVLVREPQKLVVVSASPAMADNGIAGPPAKKRVASRQLSKNDGSDSETETVPQESGSFRKASDAVLASRRIVKVRRPTSIAPSAPNPFATIRLVPPSTAVELPLASSAPSGPDAPNAAHSLDTVVSAASLSTAVSASQETDSKCINTSRNEINADNLEEAQNSNLDGISVEGEVASKPEEHKIGPVVSTSGEEELANPADHEKEGTEQHEGEGNENPSGLGEEQVEDQELQSGPGVEEAEKLGDLSDQTVEDQPPQIGAAATVLSSDKRAFADSFRSFATAFSSSSFSFGTTPSSFGTPTGFASFRSSWAFGSSSASGSSSGSAFSLKCDGEGGLSTPSTSLASSNGGTFQLFGSQLGTISSLAPVSSSVQSSKGSRPFQEVSVETGEEQEKVAFSADATLFEFADGGWKERGKGELKVNISEDTVGKSRLVMRSKGNYRLLLNASLFPDMKMTSMESRGVTFVCVNSAGDGKNGLTTYAVKLKDSLSASGFREAVDTYKGKSHADLKTPENSPRAPHDSGRDTEATEL